MLTMESLKSLGFLLNILKDLFPNYVPSIVVDFVFCLEI